MDKQNLQKLRELPIEAVAERLGLRVSRHKCLCPFHDDHHASLSFSTRRNTFCCFVCGAKGGTIDLVMKYLNMDFKEACRWLQEKTLPLAPPCREGSGYTCNDGYSPYCKEDGSGVRLFDASRYLRFFEHPWLNEEARRFLFDERRLDERVVRWCRLSSYKDRNGVPWLSIPYFDSEWRLVGVQYRNLVKGGLPRFRFPSGCDTSIYGMQVLGRLRQGGKLFIAEGVTDCLALLSSGRPAIAIPSATLLSKKDIEILSTLNATPGTAGGLTQKERSIEFHIYPDQDVPGERLFLQLKEVLPSLVRHQLPPGCKDFGEHYARNEK